MAESAYLKRLRRAVERSGLTAEPAVAAAPVAELVVSGRLVRAIHQHLLRLRPAVAGKMVDEMAALVNEDECALLLHGKGYTHLHAVHFLCEFADHYCGLEDGRHFAAAVGWEGSGLHGDGDIISLMELMVAALPPGDGRTHLGMALKELAPLFLDHIFPSSLFKLAIEPQANGLEVEFCYADPDQVEAALARVGLAGDMGTLFARSLLQVQETVRKGLAILVQDAERALRVEGRMDTLSEDRRRALAAAGRASWSVQWEGEVELIRCQDPAAVLALVRSLHANMHRRELEYFQERVHGLEMRVEELEAGDKFQELVGGSVPMQRVYRLIEQVGATELTALVRGESGTGKELVARAIHQCSARCEGPFVAVNCAAFPESLLESELFGHEKGAFTGADRAKPGRFELAHGGTLLLDEVGDIPLPTQVKLLRVMETQAFERLGGTDTMQVDIRFIGATNRPLEEMIAAGSFREDFYFRLNVLPVALPPLREHKEDIPHLARHFAERIGRRSGKPIERIARGAIRRLVDSDWPGNVRQLQNAIERAVALYAHDRELDEAAVVQALGLEVETRGNPGLNMRQRELIELLGASEVGLTVGEIQRQLGARQPGGGRSGRTLQNDLRKLAALGYADWVKDGSAHRYSLRDSA